jgi:hypothetical protein
MKIRLTFEVETPDEAREILRAVENLAKVPYRLEGFGTPVVKEVPPTEIEENWDVVPDAPPAQRIGSETYADLIRLLNEGLGKAPLTAEEINEGLLRAPSQVGQTRSILHLLVRRGVLQFNGSEYRVKSS